MITNFNSFKKTSLLENRTYNNIIDYTYLKSYGKIDDIKRVCNDAKDNKFYSVCLLPNSISTAKSFLDDTNIKVVATIGLNDGSEKSNVKINEIIKNNINFDELDFVMNYKMLKELSNTEEGEKYDNIYTKIKDEILNATRLCHKDGKLIKIIIEIEELTFDDIKTACEICIDCSVDYVQTSTGYAKNNISFEEKLNRIKYMRKILPQHINIKASGGIRTKDQIAILLPYVDRIGTSKVIL